MADRSPFTAEQLAFARSVLADSTSTPRARRVAEEALALHARFDVVLADGRTMSEAMGLDTRPAPTAGIARTAGGFTTEFVAMSPSQAAKRLAELESGAR
jgi:hypothetical protein